MITFRDETRAADELVLPHPRAHSRHFVLQPLCEIAPTLILPGQSKNVVELLRRLPPDSSVQKLK